MENKEHNKLIEVLKFTPRTYTIQMWGYGGEVVMGTVDREIYDYFKKRRLDLSEYSWDSDYAEQHDIPDDMQPFSPGSWYDCDNMAHCHGVERSAGTLEILDENNNTVFEARLEDMTGDEDNEPRIECTSETAITDKGPGQVVFVGNSNEKGTFFEGEFELKEPFDIRKLCLCYEEVDGNQIINIVTYDNQDVDNSGGSTDGKSSDFGFYLITEDGHERYRNMDDIDYPKTDWFSKKIEPVRPGVYEVMTAGRNSYCTNAKWNGSMWVSPYLGSNEVKIKEWRGLAVDPDAE